MFDSRTSDIYWRVCIYDSTFERENKLPSNNLRSRQLSTPPPKKKTLKSKSETKKEQNKTKQNVLTIALKSSRDILWTAGNRGEACVLCTGNRKPSDLFVRQCAGE